MRVFINGRFAIQPMSGVQRYASEIVRALDQMGNRRPDLTFELLSPPGAPDAGLRNIPQRWIGLGSGHAWEQSWFGRAARDGVALSLAMSGPIFHPRQIVVLHDAAVHRHPEFFSPRYAAAHRVIERQLARRATIATVSHFSRRELAAVLGIGEAAILLAPNGADHARVCTDPSIVGRFGLDGRPFFLTLGNLTANKNLAVVLRALGRIADPALRVVAVGEQRRSVFGTIALTDDLRLILAGRLTDPEVAGLMRQARALIFPSRYEGFGLPPLEAMAIGCPVLASNCDAVVEVCGGAAEHFRADDDAALASLMAAALTDDGSWRVRRVAAGLDRANQYRWEDSVRALVEACAALADRRAIAA